MKLILFKDTGDIKEVQPTSVIVCAWNEEENLKELVPLLLNQEHPSLEVVIVDDRSVDQTYDYLVKQKKQYHNLKVVRVDSVPDHMNAKKYALLLGIKAATHDCLLLTDADCRPTSPLWAKEMSSRYQKNTNFVLGFSPYKSESSLLNLLIRYETLLTGLQYLTSTLWGNPYMGVGRNLSYRKSFFLEKNGFSGIQHIMGGDDDLFVNRHATGANSKICIEPTAIMVSTPKKTWKAYYSQKRRHFSVGKHYLTADKIKLSLFSISQILFWICFVTLIVLTLNPYLVAGGFGLRLLFQIILFGLGAKKLSVKFPIVLIPMIDLIFTVFLPLVSLPALLSKKIKWR